MNKFVNVGICIGASVISVVNVEPDSRNKPIINGIKAFSHNGNPLKSIKEILTDIEAEKIVITGRGIKDRLNIPAITEAQAIEHALEYLKLNPAIVISAGAENFIIYFINKKRKIYKVTTGNKCASGTGEFFVQQLKRMNINIEELDKYDNSTVPYNISGRCSVFCKSDCTHALNKGIDKKAVVAGLNKMMADKIVNLISKHKDKSILLIGGTTKNKGFVKSLKDSLPNLYLCNESTYFEALGASIYAYYDNVPTFNYNEINFNTATRFTFHKPLSNYINNVTFKEIIIEEPKEGDECILGLDVGSTTTKAVLLRVWDNAIVGKVYLRTNGNPVEASINCYKLLAKDLKCNINIIGLGVTGSGREIAVLHAQTNSVINEIIAHAAATSYFDNTVDTIFEIGGQDAKYTHLTGGTASDYAMNEACSAGTGSFLEEAAEETLKVKYTDIAEKAIAANNPPNFNDQCAAFISSDIKNALNEGIEKDDILAGLVYSICQNYVNRVKGSRPIGKKIFMQGGVCYNKAVPVAMAALTGKKIIVPPEPGLMGAFGVAIEVKNRLNAGLIAKKTFNLNTLIDTKINYNKSFICPGGVEKCDRKCEITLFEINGKNYPFGGACSLYEGNILDKKVKPGINYVKIRQDIVFNKYVKKDILNKGKTIGILKSFLTNTYYPLFYNFFTSIGFNVILEEQQDKEGVQKMNSAFCYPVEISHNLLQNLIKKKPDYIFIPHIKEFVKNEKDELEQKACVILQAESYYLKTAFKEEIEGIEILSPVISFNDLKSSKNGLIELAVKLGVKLKKAEEALSKAVNIQEKVFEDFQSYGRKFLEEINSDNDKIGIVLLGRAYNSFADEANMGIPKKISSRGISVIPLDFLSYDVNDNLNHMYWGQGSTILRAAKFIKNYPNLFSVYITNFSCGPDSFLLGYFRDIMGSKPSLTLELDSHTADAGINTRIEAAIDIFNRYKLLKHEFEKNENWFKPLKLTTDGKIFDGVNNKVYSLYDPNVKIILPSMGRHSSLAMQANFRYFGINSEVLPLYNNDTLNLGRGNTLCKECLPLQLCTGSLLEYCKKRNDNNEITLYFMSTGNGPCRFGQYSVFLENVIAKNNIPRLGLFTLSDEDGYTGFGQDFFIRGWVAFVIADVMKNIENALKVLAYNKSNALKLFNDEWDKIQNALSSKSINEVYKCLENAAEVFYNIEKRYSIKQAKKISLIGEIFVRHDEFSKMNLIESFAAKDFVVNIAPISEYVYYSDYLARKKKTKNTLKEIVYDKVKTYEQKRIERKIKSILAKSDLIEYETIEIEKIIELASSYLPDDLEGEPILTVGSALKEIINKSCGIVSLGPFGCMPSRIAESILNVEMNYEGKLKSERRMDYINNFDSLPFLAIETDGNLFPPIIQSKIEIFMLNAERLYFEMKSEPKEDFATSVKALIKYIVNFYTEKIPPYSLNYDES
jgi:predicted CoA-substrate-specific enzyme activase